MKKITIKIRDLFEKLNLNEPILEETGYKNNKNIFVKTPSGELTKINHFVKKPKQEVISVKLENNIIIKCSPNHIFIDKNNNNTFAKDAIEIQTIYGSKNIIEKERIQDSELYDISIDNPHLYVSTNGVIHHNTKFSNLLFKHLFQEPENIPYDKLVAIPELDEQFFNVAYVKSTDILAMDEFWRTLQKELPDFVILDDLDYMLTKRESEVMTSDDAKKNVFLNQLLSFTDGVQKNKTKFIITTNQHFDDVDTALLRKGRLFNILQFRKLKNIEALKIWLEQELKEEEFHSLFQDEVLQSDLGSEIAKRKNKRIKNTSDSYLLEPEISKIKRKNKRMTL